MKGNKTNIEDLSSTVLQNSLLNEYSGKENTNGKVMPAHRMFKESAQEDIAIQQKEDRLRRIQVTMSDAKVEHVEPHVFVSENEPYTIKEAKKEPINRKSETIQYIRFRRIIDVFNEIIGLMGREVDVNMFILENTLNIRYSDDISSSTTLFNVNENDEECMRTILKSVSLILDNATKTNIFSSILNKIK